MGNKVKMSEVHDLKDSISKSLQSLSNNTNTLKTKMNDLKSNNNFKGQTAESINSYNDSFHIETINRIEKIKEEFESKFKSAISAFHSDVDNDHSAVLDSSAINDYKNELEKAANNIEKTKSRMNSTIGGVRDLTSAETISKSDVKDKGKALAKHAEDTIDDLSNFQNQHGMDELDLITMISPVATMASKVKNMPANRSKISKSASQIKQQYKLYSENNQFVEMKNELKKYQELAYGGKKYSKYVKTALQLKNYVIAAMIAGDGDFFKGDELLRHNKLSSIGSKKSKLINASLNTNLENIQGKRLLKATKFIFDKNNTMKMSDKLTSAFKMTRNFDDSEFKNIKQIAGQKNIKNLLKRTNGKGLNELTSSDISNWIKKKTNIKDITLNEINDFKAKNKLGKVLKSMKYGGKLLGPIGGVLAVGSNFASEKSMQRKIVDSGVDLGAMAATTGASTAIGASIGGPVGAGLGLGIGIIMSAASEAKIIKGKSATDIVKDKANEKVSAIRNSKMWKDTKNIVSEGGNGNKGFGKTMSSII
ncbi:T7SS effector LXG polymorphic toxin [Staphylococcus epidermidis]|uniref:T7SS effector LXG polymorphic toxin n=1 Tax=Staphylococcus TaxID=1279 RepID=UPI00024E5845|nr:MULTISPECIES: T7SS effector LXG polymorphic toxin [Staphylococcus]EHR97569.1 hypothetical protein SEVCU128_1586 [Staphylococcus epidermidis VCU128]EJE06535.1 hypothetical protein HMPREF9983_02614 [Staphylococcus epidermidis NIHLM023]KSZ62259.1 hypothetical protein RES1_05565 [Staphylococcus epidermidis]KSZ65035.1 hypothetical protein RES3_04550 [Staphylococcus epidermidis]KSZ67368.1 hypothetical protein RES2_02940 [Staphylococcus epidermidis]